MNLDQAIYAVVGFWGLVTIGGIIAIGVERDSMRTAVILAAILYTLAIFLIFAYLI